VFAIAAYDAVEQVVALSFEAVEMILGAYLPLIADSFFGDVVACLTGFANNRHFKDYSFRALDLLVKCARLVAIGVVNADGPTAAAAGESAAPPRPASTPPAGSSPEGKALLQFTDSEPHLRLWMPVLGGIAFVVSHPHIDIRTRALDLLFKVLTEYRAQFSPRLRGLLFRHVVVPLFDCVLRPGSVPAVVNPAAHTASPSSSPAVAGALSSVLREDNEWLTTTCLGAMTKLVALYPVYSPGAPQLLDDVLQLLTRCILQENESLARIGSQSLIVFVMLKEDGGGGVRWVPWDERQWTSICLTLDHIISRNLPEELLTQQPPNQEPPAGVRSSTPLAGQDGPASPAPPPPAAPHAVAGHPPAASQLTLQMQKAPRPAPSGGSGLKEAPPPLSPRPSSAPAASGGSSAGASAKDVPAPPVLEGEEPPTDASNPNRVVRCLSFLPVHTLAMLTSFSRRCLPC
jgi:hypothetical protein